MTRRQKLIDWYKSLKKSDYKPEKRDEEYYVTDEDGNVDFTQCYVYYIFSKPRWGRYTTDERRLVLELDRAGYEVKGTQPIEYSVKYLFEQRKECVQCPGLGACRWGGDQYWAEIDDETLKVYVHTSPCKSAADVNAAKALALAQKTAGVPLRYRSTIMRDFDAKGQAILLTAIRAFVEKGQGLWVYGAVGTGKTMVSSIIANACLKRKRTVRFCNVPQLLQRLRTAVADGTVALELSALIEVDILILDDIGAENQSAWTLEQIFTIMNERYNSDGDGRQMLITSNPSPLELRQQWSRIDRYQAERIISRIRGLCNVVEIVGIDRRLG